MSQKDSEKPVTKTAPIPEHQGSPVTPPEINPVADEHNSIFNTVLKLHSFGYSVIPSGGGETHKAPLVSWTEYQERPPTKEQLQAWETDLKPGLWGIVTGRGSRVVALDADNQEAKIELQRELSAPHVTTPRGGGHWYCEYPGQTVKTVAGLLPGIDVRGDGGFINIAGERPDGKYIINGLPVPGTLVPWEKVPERIKAAMKKKPQAVPTQEMELIPRGQNDSWLTSLAGSYRQKGDNEAQIFEKLKVDVLRLEQDSTRPYKEEDLRRIARSIAKKPPGVRAPDPKVTENQFEPDMVRMTDVTPEKIRWLWPPYIPFGKLTLLEGDPGEGKSFCTLAITTAVSNKAALPLQNGAEPAEGPVLLISAEDGLADTVRPRLDQMRANLTAISALDGLFTLDDNGFNYLEDRIAEIVPALVVIDPLVAYLSGDMDINKANQVRYATSRLHKLAEKYGCAVLAVRHLTKSPSQKAIHRGSGSIDFSASARSILIAGSDADNPDLKALIHIKSNLAPKGPSIGYELKPEGFFWTGESDLTYANITDTSDAGSSLKETMVFVMDYLGDGEPVLSSELEKEAVNQGYTPRTLRRAKEKLTQDNVMHSFKQGEVGVRGSKWYCQLTEN